VFEDNDRPPWVISNVKDSQVCLVNDLNREYLGIASAHTFTNLFQSLIWGTNISETIKEQITSIETVSGTGENRMAALFVVNYLRPQRIFIILSNLRLCQKNLDRNDDRIKTMRRELRRRLEELGTSGEWSRIKSQSVLNTRSVYGMSNYGLNKDNADHEARAMYKVIGTDKLTGDQVDFGKNPIEIENFH
ncbi:hypothetical protein F1880_005131, partial [Penicillium rolfsii]